MAAEIQRTTELFIVGKLTAAVAGHSFYPFTGGTVSTDAAEIEPPFTVVSIDTAEKTHQQEGTWICTGTLQIITHSADSSSQAHALLVRTIYAALDDIVAEAPDAAFSFHGLDVTNITAATDPSGNAHANIVKFTCGVGG